MGKKRNNWFGSIKAAELGKETIEDIVEEEPTQESIEQEVKEEVVTAPCINSVLLPKQVELGSIYHSLFIGCDYIKGTYPLFPIQERILKWNAVRDNFDFDEELELKILNSEIAEGEAEDATLFDKIDSACDAYVVFTGTLAKTGRLEINLSNQFKNFVPLYLNTPAYVQQLGFNFKRCMEETLKEIESREQDPEQKARWEAGNKVAGEKWEKNREQDPTTLYKADYGSCRG